VIIDWHAHIYTPEEAAGDLGTLDGKNGPKWGERGCPMVLENFLDAHYANGIDISVVTNAAHYLRGKADTKNCRGPEMDRLRRRSAEKHKGVSTRSPPSCRAAGPAFIKETERAIQQLGLKGIFIIQPQGSLSRRRRGAAVLGAGAGPRRAGDDPSAPSRLRRGADEGVSLASSIGGRSISAWRSGG
jgi:hypothetical protein